MTPPSNLWITAKARSGSRIHDVCREAAELAMKAGDQVELIFNDVVVFVAPGESAESVYRRWDGRRVDE